MSIARTIVTLLIALSVAMLPAAGSAGVSVKSPEAAGISTTEDMADCCPPKANPCEKGHGGLCSHGDVRAQVLQLSGPICGHRISFGLCEDDGVVYRQSILFAGEQSTLPTSSGLTSP